jgi:hypothetical protein
MRHDVLQRLREDGSSLVDDSFLRGERDRIEPNEWEPFAEPAPREIDLVDFNEVVDHAIARLDAYQPAIDSFVAPRLHEVLDLTRREASEPGIWRFLAVIARPDFVRHRWAFASRKTTFPRFWQLGVRPNSNAIARLWWIAELTRDDDSYERTDVVLERQPLATAFFVRSFSHYQPAIFACIDVLSDAPPDVLAQVMLRLTTMLSTIVVEGRSYEELVELVHETRTLVER